MNVTVLAVWEPGRSVSRNAAGGPTMAKYAAEGNWVKAIKRALDPNNVMNPGKQSLDEAYE